MTVAPSAASLAPRAPIVAVTGAKGGVGKTTLVVHVATALGRLGRRVAVVDGNAGLASIDVMLGLAPTRTLEHVVDGECGIEDVLIEGPPNVLIAAAASGVPRMAALERPERERLLAAIERLRPRFDVVLVDTGPGLGATSIALQLASTRAVVVTTPDPTALVDTYASLKVLWNASPHHSTGLLVNATRGESEGVRARDRIVRAALHFLGRAPDALAPVRYDPGVADAIRRQRTLFETDASSPAARGFERIALAFAPACAAFGLASRIDATQPEDTEFVPSPVAPDGEEEVSH